MKIVGWYTYFLFLIINNAFSMVEPLQKTIEDVDLNPKIKKEVFLDLINHSLTFLKNKKMEITCSKNESGFSRIVVPVNEFKKYGIDKIRLNFWCNANNINIQPETIHNHPRYFESFILSGGYAHAIYEKSPNGDEYESYRLIKEENNKCVVVNGIVKLSHTEDKLVSSNDIIVLPTSLIHRVLSAKDMTLSLNVIYSLNNNEHLNSFYDVFVSPRKDSFKYIKTKRKFLGREETISTIDNIANLLEEFIAEK